MCAVIKRKVQTGRDGLSFLCYDKRSINNIQSYIPFLTNKKPSFLSKKYKANLLPACPGKMMKS